MAASVPPPSPTQHGPPSVSDSGHFPKNRVEAATIHGEDKTPQFADGLDHLDSTQYIERFKKYDAEYARQLLAKYFSAKTLNEEIFYEEITVGDDIIKSSRLPCFRSYAYPVVGSGEQPSNGSPSPADSQANLLDGDFWQTANPEEFKKQCQCVLGSFSVGMTLLHEIAKTDGIAAAKAAKEELEKLKEENKALQEQNKEVPQLKEENEALRKQNEELALQNSKVDSENMALKKQVEQQETKSAQQLSKPEANLKKLQADNQKLQVDANVAIHEFKAENLAAANAHLDQLNKVLADKSKLLNEVRRLRRENFDLTRYSSKLKRLKADVGMHARNDADAIYNTELARVKYEAFVNCIRQIQFLNPGIRLNLKGVSPDHVVKDGKLVNLKTHQVVDLEDPNLESFDPSAPFVPPLPEPSTQWGS